MIEIKNVSKSYVKGKKSVDDLNLEIKNDNRHIKYG